VRVIAVEVHPTASTSVSIGIIRVGLIRYRRSVASPPSWWLRSLPGLDSALGSAGRYLRISDADGGSSSEAGCPEGRLEATAADRILG